MSEQIKTTPADANHFHSEYGASGAKTWRNCPGSVQAIKKAKLEKRIPEKTETEHSKLGTLAHNWADKILKKEAVISDLPSDMRDSVGLYVDLCNGIAERSISADPGTIVSTEIEVPLFYKPEHTGTCDFSVFSSIRGLQMVDYKHGVGVLNTAFENDQLAIYALSYLAKLKKDGVDIKDSLPVALAIMQPRHRDFNGVDVWTTTVGELRDIAIDIEADFIRAQDENQTEIVPTQEGCQFCDLKKVCTARGKTSFGGLPAVCNPLEDFDDETKNINELPVKVQKERIKEINIATFTPEQIAFIVNNGASIKKIIDDTISGERERIEAGGELHHVKLIQGNLGCRKWNNEQEAEKLIKSKLGASESYQARKIITAPQALAKLENMELSTRFSNKLESLVSREYNKPKIVPIDHSAPAIEFKTVADEFEDENEQEKQSDFKNEDFM